MLYDKKWDLDTTSQHLLRAADYIEKHGWCQGYLKDPDGRVCLQGALIETQDRPNTHYWLATDARVSVYLDKCCWNWNDKIGRTKEQVINLLREVAYAEVYQSNLK